LLHQMHPAGHLLEAANRQIGHERIFIPALSHRTGMETRVSPYDTASRIVRTAGLGDGPWPLCCRLHWHVAGGNSNSVT
jgi:hypothetical protein